MSLCKLTSITVKRQIKGTTDYREITFPSHTWYQPGKKQSPTLDELRDKLKEQLKLHPELNTSLLRSLLDKHKHQLIYTPPYLPDVQPIERAWAYIKAYVASQFKNGRNMDELTQQVFKGMYGDGTDHHGLTMQHAGNIIRHSLHCCEALISEDDSLGGDIFTLRCAVPLTKPIVGKDIKAHQDLDADEDEEESAGERKEEKQSAGKERKERETA
jgi:hypothetical protein